MKKRYVLPVCLLLMLVSCAAGAWFVLKPRLLKAHLSEPVSESTIANIQSARQSLGTTLAGRR